MTRTLMFIAGLLFFALVASLIAGFASSAPGLLLVGLLCAMPMFMLALGAAVGRASNELTIVRKERGSQSIVSRSSNVRRNIPTPESLS